MGHPRPLFRLFLSFQTNITILQQINVKNVHPAQSSGFEISTFWLRVSSLNHYTRAPALIWCFFRVTRPSVSLLEVRGRQLHRRQELEGRAAVRISWRTRLRRRIGRELRFRRVRVHPGQRKTGNHLANGCGPGRSRDDTSESNGVGQPGEDEQLYVKVLRSSNNWEKASIRFKCVFLNDFTMLICCKLVILVKTVSVEVYQM